MHEVCEHVVREGDAGVAHGVADGAGLHGRGPGVGVHGQDRVHVRAEVHRDRGVDGLRIGIVDEGFGREESGEAVGAAVLAAADLLGSLGAKVERISVPTHNDIGNIFLPMIAEGMVRQLGPGPVSLPMTALVIEGRA